MTFEQLYHAIGSKIDNTDLKIEVIYNKEAEHMETLSELSLQFNSLGEPYLLADKKEKE